MAKKSTRPQPSTDDLTEQLLQSLLPAGVTAPDAGASLDMKNPSAPGDLMPSGGDPVSDAGMSRQDMGPVPGAEGDLTPETIHLEGVDVVGDPARAGMMEPTLPGFVMEDVPPVTEDVTWQDLPHPHDPLPSAPFPSDPFPQGQLEMDVAKVKRYEHRIEILEAYQYPGSVVEAPVWVDRNWIGFKDYDDLRKLPAGPVLLVPTYRGDVAVCRKGDYVCQQVVKMGAGLQEVRLDVWEQTAFERLFVPA